MTDSRFGGFQPRNTPPERRAFFDVIRQFLRLTGGTLTGPLRLPGGPDVTATSTDHPFQIGLDSALNVRMDNNEIQWMNNGVVTNGRVQNEGGDFYIGPTAGPELHFEESTGEVKDADGRQFIRTDTTRTSAILIQSDTESATTDANGDISVTFDEAFTTTPEVVVSFVNSSTLVNIVVIRARSSTGFTVRIYNTSATAVASQTRAFSWIAFGSKTDIV